MHSYDKPQKWPSSTFFYNLLLLLLLHVIFTAVFFAAIAWAGSQTMAYAARHDSISPLSHSHLWKGCTVCVGILIPSASI